MTQSLRHSVRRDHEIRRAESSPSPGSDSAGIGGRIRLLREQLGLTQEKLAARLGVAFPTVNRWENGHTQPSPLALRQIEALLAETGEIESEENAARVSASEKGGEP